MPTHRRLYSQPLTSTRPGGPQFALKYKGALCGLNGFDKINLFHKTGALGYWLGSAFAGKGIITESSKILFKLGYEEYGLNKIELHCSEENKKSCAIAERLGFVYEATLRDCEWLYTRYVSNAIYSMLAAEYFLVHKKRFSSGFVCYLLTGVKVSNSSIIGCCLSILTGRLRESC